MEEPKTDVMPVEPSTTEQPTEQVAEPVQQEQTTEAPVTQTPAPTVSDVDEFGVPWKNRASEWRRKTEELTEKIPQMIEEKLSNFSQNAGQRKYTIEELEAFSTQTDNIAYAQWARGEIRKLELDEQAKVVRTEIGKWRKEQDDNFKRQQSYNYVVQNYPDAFVKSPTGQILGFNNQSPLMQQIDVIMRDSRFANDPEGLIAAADMAWARLQRSQQPKIQQQVQQQKEEIKNLQKKTLVEGGGKQSIGTTPPHRAAIEKLKKTGTIKDAQEAIGLIWEKRMASQAQE